MKNIAILIVVIALLFSGCVKDLEDEGIYTNETEIVGMVVENSTNAPIPNIKVKVTDGDHIHASVITGTDGTFSLNVNFREVNNEYYLLLDGFPELPTKQEQLLGFGTKVYDYKSLVLYDKTDEKLLPKVTTDEFYNITMNTATISGTVSSNGGHSLIERGICYANHQSPTIDDMHNSAGAELGTFSCNLTDLQTNVTYYVRAYATNTIGTAYGEQKSFTPDGLPTVTTIPPTLSGMTVTTGGNVTSDGGSPVIARGVCYGNTPYPDLSSSHNHTTNGSGTGTFGSTFTMNNSGSLYYIRAYATNSNGTSYGEQLTIGGPYLSLPTFTYGGRTYRVAPTADQTYYWNDANNYCNNLTLYGYSDWRLPTLEELKQMYDNKASIGGFSTGWYWSMTQCSSYSHYSLSFSSRSADCDSNSSYLFYVRPIRVEN